MTLTTHLIADTQMRDYLEGGEAYNYEGHSDELAVPPPGARLVACATVDRDGVSVGGSSTFWRFVWDVTP